MRVLKLAGIALVLYVAVVLAFESLIGFAQPADPSTLVLISFDGEGEPHERVLSRLESGGKLYVAVNHWPRRWYRRVLAHPDVEAAVGGQRGPYRAVAISAQERERLNAEHPLPLGVRFLTGFPPRYFVRLDPR